MLTLRSPVAPSWLLSQSRHTRLGKPLYPLIDKTPTNPDHSGNVGDRHPLGDQQDNSASSRIARQDGFCSLLHQQGPTLRRRETDREGGAASMWHKETFKSEEVITFLVELSGCLRF
jgi:hypothetical protein